MGGKSSPVSVITKPVEKVVKKVKEDVKNKTAETAAKFLGGGVVLEGLSRGFTAATGKKADVIFNPIGTILGEGAQRFIDDPKAQAKQHKLDIAKAAQEQQAQLDQFNKNQAQSAAEEAAGQKLISDRAAQARRRVKAGRESTILSQKLGESSTTGRKSLLGL